jgi:hypothetical protein
VFLHFVAGDLMTFAGSFALVFSDKKPGRFPPDDCIIKIIFVSNHNISNIIMSEIQAGCHKEKHLREAEGNVYVYNPI